MYASGIPFWFIGCVSDVWTLFLRKYFFLIIFRVRDKFYILSVKFTRLKLYNGNQLNIYYNILYQNVSNVKHEINDLR